MHMIKRWHGSARVLDDNASLWQSEKFDPRFPPSQKNPEPIITKICRRHLPLCKISSQYDYQFRPLPHICENAHLVTRLDFWVLPTAYGQDAHTDFYDIYVI